MTLPALRRVIFITGLGIEKNCCFVYISGVSFSYGLHIILMTLSLYIGIARRATSFTAMIANHASVYSFYNKIAMKTFDQRIADGFCIAYRLPMSIKTLLTFKNTHTSSTRKPRNNCTVWKITQFIRVGT